MTSPLLAAILDLADKTVMHRKRRSAVSGLLPWPRSEGKDPVISMRAQGLGAVLAIVGALGIVLPLVAGWSAPCPWGPLLAFVAAMLAGIGATFVVAGLLERRREY